MLENASLMISQKYMGSCPKVTRSFRPTMHNATSTFKSCGNASILLVSLCKSPDLCRKLKKECFNPQCKFIVGFDQNMVPKNPCQVELDVSIFKQQVIATKYLSLADYH